MTVSGLTGKASRPERTIAWMRHGTVLFADTLAHMCDEAFDAPSTLPGWTRRHVTAHVARNADALVNLLIWARTGTRTPMYRDPGQRRADIAISASQTADALRTDLFASARRLDAALDTMPNRCWTASVESASGRAIVAAEVPWLRTREVYVHVVDLQAGVSFTDVPVDVIEALIDDAVRLLSTRDGVPFVSLKAVDITRQWTLGRPSARRLEPMVVTAKASALAAYLIGRPITDAVWDADVRPPRLPVWL
jgi:maleylpyruvate isomerase